MDMSSSPSSGSMSRLGTSPSQSAGQIETKKSGHSRQSSAGRIIESGLSLIKGHSRRGSDQNTAHKRQGSDGKRPASKPSPAAASNPFDEPPKQNKTGSLKPPKSESANPFDEPSSTGAKNLFESGRSSSSGANPFESKAANPFEDKPTNPFEEATPGNPFGEEPSNPFMDEPKTRSKPSNPFGEETGNNPFE